MVIFYTYICTNVCVEKETKKGTVAANGNDFRGCRYDNVRVYSYVIWHAHRVCVNKRTCRSSEKLTQNSDWGMERVVRRRKDTRETEQEWKRKVGERERWGIKLQEQGKATSSHMRDISRTGKRKTLQMYGYILHFFITGFTRQIVRVIVCAKRYMCALSLNSNNILHMRQKAFGEKNYLRSDYKEIDISCANFHHNRTVRNRILFWIFSPTWGRHLNVLHF